MAKFYYKRIAEAVASSESGAKRINTVYQNKFETAKEEMLQEFEDDDVTKELRAGVDAKNISETFIGFDQNDEPIDKLKTVLEEEVVLARPSKGEVAGNTVRYKFSVRIPNESIKNATKLPFEEGLSWADGIQNGISGFGAYLRGLFKSPPSHSGGGLQADHPIRSGTFKTRPYLTKLFNDLVAKFKK